MSEDASVQVEEHKGFCNHWSSYRLSLRQTWRELKLRPRSSINWMIDIFAGTSTDHKADFTFCLNAGFYLQVFNMALVYAVDYPVLIALRYLRARSSIRVPKEYDEVLGTELYIKANVGFAEMVWGMATDNLDKLCGLVFDYGLEFALDYFIGYLLYSGVVMSKNRCVVCCLNLYLMLDLCVRLKDEIEMLLVDPKDNKRLKFMLSRSGAFWVGYCWSVSAKNSLLFRLMMIKSAFHIRFNGETTSETESLLQDKHEL